jgi:hypothetical protein
MENRGPLLQPEILPDNPVDSTIRHAQALPVKTMAVKHTPSPAWIDYPELQGDSVATGQRCPEQLRRDAGVELPRNFRAEKR